MKKVLFLSFALIAPLFLSYGVYGASRDMNDNMPMNVQMTKMIRGLENNGYIVIRDIKFDNGVYKVDAINAQGKDVEAKVNPTTGMVTQSADGKVRITTFDAAQKVENAGYKSIYSIEASGDNYKVKAIQSNGDKISLTVDGANGNIRKDLF